jgi:hypothetical protein
MLSIIDPKSTSWEDEYMEKLGLRYDRAIRVIYMAIRRKNKLKLLCK